MDTKVRDTSAGDDQPVQLSEDGLFHVNGSPMHLMMSAERLHRSNAGRVLRDLQIDHRMWRLLAQLVDHRKRSVQEIANSTGFDRTTISKLVDEAERLNLVTRTVDSRDRRRVSVALSRKGWSALRRCSPRMAGLVNSYFSDFEPGEFEELIRLVKKMRQNIQRQSAGLEDLVDLY